MGSEEALGYSYDWISASRFVVRDVRAVGDGFHCVSECIASTSNKKLGTYRQ